MIGFSERIVPAAALIPGDRVVWFGGTFRVVQSISPMADGTNHWRCEFSNDTNARYAGKGLVRVLEVAPIEAPV